MTGHGQKHGHHQHVSGLVFGILIIGLGILLLLDGMGVLAPFGVWDFWPLALVFVGAVNLFMPSAAPHRVFGGLLIAGGTVLQLHKLEMLSISMNVVWPIFVILIGIYVFYSTWFVRKQGIEADEDSPDLVSEIAVFSGSETINNSSDFRGGELLALMGGCSLDLSRAKMQADQVVLYARAFMGGIDVRVPDDWDVTIKGIGILGGYEDKTRRARSNGDESEKPKRLIIKGYAIMGGVDIKN